MLVIFLIYEFYEEITKSIVRMTIYNLQLIYQKAFKSIHMFIGEAFPSVNPFVPRVDGKDVKIILSNSLKNEFEEIQTKKPTQSLG